MRVLFVTQEDFSKPSELHVLAFAEQLIEKGHVVMISVTGDPASAAREQIALPAGVDIVRHRFAGPFLTAAARRTAVSFRPDIVHAWTPRVPAMPAARAYARATKAPYVVHFDDDEWRQWPHAGQGLRARLGRLRRRLAWRLHPPMWGLSTPRTLAWAGREASGLDALTPALAAEVESRLGRHCAVILPATPSRAQFADGASVLVRDRGQRIALFTGRVVPTSLSDFDYAIQAVAEVRRRGIDVQLVQTGAVDAQFDLRARGREQGLDDDGLALHGHIRYADVFPTLEDADVLLQSGPPTRFNRLRLPSKIQLYLEAGRPTITFSAGLADLLREGDEVLMTHTAGPHELADRLSEVLTDDVLAARLGLGARRAAARIFDGPTNTGRLIVYYEQAISSSGSRGRLRPSGPKR